MAHSIEMTLEDLKALEQRVDRQDLQERDWPVVGALVSNFVHKEEGKIDRLAAKLAQNSAANSENSSDQSDAPTEPEAPPMPPVSSGETSTPKGHGRNTIHDFTQAKHVTSQIPPSNIGALCERCKKGRMKRYRERTLIRIMGQPLFGAEIYHAEQVRCPLCGNKLSAPLPKGVDQGIGKSVVYHWSACALLLVIHYTHGMPFKRLESLHKGWGIPFPDADQWEIASQAIDLLSPLLKALEQHGVRKVLNLRIDDTGMMVLEIQRQILAELKAAKALGLSESTIRTGINATCVRMETPEGIVILYYTGRHHAGEIIDQILSHRPPSAGVVIKLSDGASKNFDHNQSDKVIEATCHAHGFLKFRAVKDQYPIEYALVGESYAKIFENDARAKELEMSSEKRLEYHQKYSRPWLDKIYEMCASKVQDRLVLRQLSFSGGGASLGGA
jgi:transposase